MKPIFKWAGGKTQLLPHIKAYFPKKYGVYVEPFLGSGAVFLDVQPKKARLNDFNPEIINVYKCVRDNLEALKAELILLQNQYNAILNEEDQRSYFNARREEYNANILNADLSIRDAALFMFLNKACYNGLYRVNQLGYYNSPFGKRKKIKLVVEEDLNECSKALKKAKIFAPGDFSQACKGLKKGDFVYFDSPYYNTFDTYQAGGFPEKDHFRLAELVAKLTQKGVFCMLSNSDTDFIKELYKDYTIRVVPVKRNINRDGASRVGTEVIITNY